MADRCWSYGYASGQILAPPRQQRLLAALSGGLHVYRDLGAASGPFDSVLPAPEVQLPGRVEPVPVVENPRAGP